MAPDKKFIQDMKRRFKTVKKNTGPKPLTASETYRKFVSDFIYLTKSKIKSFEVRTSLALCVVDMNDHEIIGEEDFIISARNFFLGNLKFVHKEDQNEEDNADFLTLLNLKPKNKLAQEVIVKLRARNNMQCNI